MVPMSFLGPIKNLLKPDRIVFLTGSSPPRGVGLPFLDCRASKNKRALRRFTSLESPTLSNGVYKCKVFFEIFENLRIFAKMGKCNNVFHMHRIFIAINLPSDIKEKILVLQKKWPTLPVRWVKLENLHITLLFLGYLNTQQLKETIQTVENIAKNHKPFAVTLNRIHYGPPEKRPPRMVWIDIAKNPELLNLQKYLEDTIFSLPSFQYKESEKRFYSPHITLGRIKQWEFRRLEPEQRPQIDEEISLRFPANSIEVMESQLKRGGAEYRIIKSFPTG